VPENGSRYYAVLPRHGVPAELHLHERGKHGFGIRGAQGSPVGNWPEVAWAWLGASGFLTRPGAERSHFAGKASRFRERALSRSAVPRAPRWPCC
jgi:hypothetical protein